MTPTSIEILQAGAVHQLDVGRLRIACPDGGPLTVLDLRRLRDALERALEEDQNDA